MLFHEIVISDPFLGALDVGIREDATQRDSRDFLTLPLLEGVETDYEITAAAMC